MPVEPVVAAATQVLAHVPGLARHGAKPVRVLASDPALVPSFEASLRPFGAAVAYPPHQAFLGSVHPRSLPPRPWTAVTGATGASPFSRTGPAGEIMPEEEFLGLLAAVDHFGLICLDAGLAGAATEALAGHRLAKHFDLDSIAGAVGDVDAVRRQPGALALQLRDGTVAGAMRRAHESDAVLTAEVLLDNLASKATATLALLHLLDRSGIDPASIDYVIGCGEEAVGDRYQRGGGNMAKAVAETAGLTAASGADVKDFCAAFIPALVMAGSLVAAGVFQRVAVVSGGSLAKLGMKFQGHLRHELPVLEDVLGGSAALVQADDGVSPRIGLATVGRHRVSAGGSAGQIMQALVVDPLDQLGLPITDVDDFATELHNPEITEPQGSGNVPDRNYRTIAALGVRRGDIERAGIDAFVERHGMPGYAPTQGHIASALCYVPHALERLTAGDAQRVMLLAKGSLFLGRMSQLSDGMSVLLERNPGGG
jgi:betaine reductase